MSGSGNTGAAFCSLYGTTTPFDSATLHELYGSHGQYVSRYAQAAKDAERDGFLLKEARQELVRAAAESSVPD